MKPNGGSCIQGVDMRAAFATPPDIQETHFFMDRFLPKDQGKRDLLTVFLISVPLMAAGFIWAVLEGGFAEPPPPAATPVSTPFIAPESTPAFLATPES